MSMMAVVMATIGPLLVSARLTFDASRNNADVLQKMRILSDHLHLHLSVAAGIESVSDSSEVLGYIEFLASDESTYRYDLDESGNVEYGQVGSLSDLVGPVTQLQFTCYDGNDMSSPITDVNEIRLIKIGVTITNASDDCPDRTFQTSVFIYKDPTTTIPNFDGWWCLDDATGTTAADSSGNARHGTLENMSGNEWTTGVLGGALQFDGDNEYITILSDEGLQPTEALTLSGWICADTWGSGSDVDPILRKGEGTPVNYQLAVVDQRLCLMLDGYDGVSSSGVTAGDTLLGTNVWYHVAATWDGSTASIYVNGLLDNDPPDSHTGSLGTDYRPLYIGGRYGADCFDGILDDVRFYSRALTAEEISELANEVNLVRYEGFEEAKVTSNVRSLTIPTPSDSESTQNAVSILGSWSTGLSHIAPSGSNRLLVFTAHATHLSDDPQVQSVTYGGQAMTKVEHEKEDDDGDRAYAAMYILDEDGIANASNSTFSPNWDKTPYDEEYTSVFLENVDQSEPFINKFKAKTKDDRTLNEDYKSTGEGDMVVFAATAGDTGYDYSVNNGFTEALELSISSADGVVAYLSADGSSVRPSVTHSYSEVQVLVGCVVCYDGSSSPITTIEGDLLIAAVATDASETISEPAGEDWTLLSHGKGDNRVTFGVWAKLASASESASHTFTWGSNEQAYGWIMRFTGHDPENPIDVMAALGDKSDSTPPSPSVTTTVNNAMILRLGGFDEDDVTVDDTGLPGHTTITMDMSDNDGDAASGGAAYMYQLEPGSSGSINFDLTNKEEYRTVTLAISPAP